MNADQPLTELAFTVSGHIARPSAEVYEAVVDPNLLSKYFTTGGANNGGTEAINGLIELNRRVARGFRNRENYRLRMLLIGGGLRL